MSPESLFFIWLVMERSKSTAVSQVGPRAKASGGGGGWRGGIWWRSEQEEVGAGAGRA